MDTGAHYLENVRFELGRTKRLAEKALDQVPDDALHRALDDESNSIAVLLQHLAGNFRSRWTDFLTTDGEKPDRHRDREFEDRPEASRKELMERWEEGWGRLLGTLESLSADDLGRTVTIRGEEHTVLEAIQRTLAHASYHVGQIVFLSKHLSSEGWRSLTIPRGRSDEVTGGYKQR